MIREIQFYKEEHTNTYVLLYRIDVTDLFPQRQEIHPFIDLDKLIDSLKH